MRRNTSISFFFHTDFLDFSLANDLQLSFNQNSFTEQYQQVNTSNQTPKFFTNINIELSNENPGKHNTQRLSNLLSGFKDFGVDIEQVLSDFQINKNSQIQELLNCQQLISQQKQRHNFSNQSSTFNKSFFFANSHLVKGISNNCKQLRQDLTLLPIKITKFIDHIKATVRQINQNISQHAVQFINKSLLKMQDEMSDILKREQQLQEQNEQLKIEIIQLRKQNMDFKKQNEDLLRLKKQYSLLETTNEQQYQLIKQLQQTLYLLQDKIKQSQTYCSTISSQLRINSIDLEKKYEKALQEMKKTLTHQIKMEIFYKLKYGYPIQIENVLQKRMDFRNVKLSHSSSFDQINQVISNLKEINSCLLEKSKHFT